MTSPFGGGNEVEIVVRARDESGKTYDEATRKAKGFAGTMKRIGEVAAGVLVANMAQQLAHRAVSFIHSTVEAASDLGESINAVGKVFESSATEVVEWGKANANAIGLSTRAFNQAATPLGAMLKNQGLQLDQVTEHTIRLTERAADMASVFNTDVSDALLAIQAGLRGEIDPLERYGVSLSAAAVQARALADSGKTSAKQLTTEEKALARLAILYEQTADSAGDFRDTSDGLANSTRIAKAQMEDAQARIGATFTPIMAKAAQVTGMLAQSFGNLPVPVQIVAVGLAGMAAAAALVTPKILAAKAALDSMANSGSKFQAGVAKTTIAIGKAAAAFAALQLVGTGVAAIFEKDLNPQIDAITQGLGKWDKAARLSGESARVFGDDAEELGRSIQQLSVNGFAETVNKIDNWAAHMMGASGPVDDATDRVTAFDAALAGMVRNGNAEKAGQVVAEMARIAGVSIEQTTSVLPAYSAALETGAKKSSILAQATEEATKSVEELDKQFEKSITEAFSFEEAQDRAADAVANLAEQVKKQKEDHEKGAGALTGNTQAARDNRDAVRDLVGLYEKMIVEAQRSGQKTDGLTGRLEDQLVSMGFARAEVKRYVDELFELEKQLAEIKSKEIEVKVRYHAERSFTGGGVREFAAGGIAGAAAGGPRSNLVWTGERGPELVRLPYGSQVYPHGDSMRMAAQPAEVKVQLEVIGGGGGRLEEMFAEMIRRYVRVVGGGNVQTAFGR